MAEIFAINEDHNNFGSGFHAHIVFPRTYELIITANHYEIERSKSHVEITSGSNEPQSEI